MPLQVERDDRGEVLDLAGQRGEAEGGVAGPVDAEEEDALGARLEDGGALGAGRRTSER